MRADMVAANRLRIHPATRQRDQAPPMPAGAVEMGVWPSSIWTHRVSSIPWAWRAEDDRQHKTSRNLPFRGTTETC